MPKKMLENQLDAVALLWGDASHAVLPPPV